MPDGTLPPRCRTAPLPSTLNVEARTVEATIATDTPVPMHDERGAYDEILDVAGMNCEPGIPVLDSHQRFSTDAIIGVIESVRTEGAAAIATIRFARSDQGDKTMRSVEEGVMRFLSVGFEIDPGGVVENSPADKGSRSKTVRKWTVREVSFVAVPADPMARIRSKGDMKLDEEPEEMTIDLEKYDASGTVVLTPRSNEEAAAEDGAEPEPDAPPERSARLTDLRTRTTPLPVSRRATAERPIDRTRAMAKALAHRVMGGDLDPNVRVFQGMSMTDAAVDCLQRAGETTTYGTATALITRALSTSDFPQVVENLMGNFLAPAYRRSSEGIRNLATSRTVPNFDPVKAIAVSDNIALDPVGENGEFTHASLDEASMPFLTVDTFGRIVMVTRKLLIQDKLGALSDISGKLGNAAREHENKSLINKLLENSGLGPTMDDGNPLFHADHGNLAATPGAISETSLSEGRLAMRRQTDPFGERIENTPTHLVVPPELETVAEKTLSAIAAAKTSDVNVFANGLALVVDSRLTHPTRWYLVANDAPGLEYAHLEGEPQPEIRSETGFDIDGLKTRVRLDFGCGFRDWRGWYCNEGA